MMRCLPLLVALVPALAAAQPTKPKPPLAKCERPSARQVAGAAKPGLRKLGELPPARPIYTVVREIDGCPTPVSVRPR